ncbi:hypothetical protein [Paraburkholderia saeva]|uniref:hypothetical protein n=1 Tax=Paraburkholderia saeva TaxID=2777537 RepID=UPI001E36CEC2|nr:hypothetical protein [Paraburkholderia saeva]
MARLIEKNDRRAGQSADALGSVPYFQHNGKCAPGLMGGNTVRAASWRWRPGLIPNARRFTPEWPITQCRMTVKHMLQKLLPRSTTMVF